MMYIFPALDYYTSRISYINTLEVYSLKTAVLFTKIAGILPSLIDDEKENLTCELDTSNIPEIDHIITIYLILLSPHFDILGIPHNMKESDMLVSGLIFFYYAIIYIMHYKRITSNIFKDIFHYTLLYMLTDHLLDNHVDMNTKKIMLLLLHNPEQRDKIDNISPILYTIAEVYESLCIRYIGLQYYLVNVFEVEMESVYMQGSNNHSSSIFLSLATRKGVLTQQVIHYIAIYNTQYNKLYNKDSFLIGEVIQLIDDSIDLQVDLDKNIYTIATNHYSIYNTLDRLWLYTIGLVLQISMPLFKCIFLIMSTYIVCRYKERYSNLLYTYVKPLSLFMNNYDGCDTINNHLLNRLTNMSL